MFSMVLVGSGSVSFDTDPDSGSSHFLIRIRIQGNYTDSTDPGPPHWLWLRKYLYQGYLRCGVKPLFMKQMELRIRYRHIVQ